MRSIIRLQSVFLMMIFLIITKNSIGQKSDAIIPEKITTASVTGKYFMKRIYEHHKNIFCLRIKNNGSFSYEKKFEKRAGIVYQGQWEIKGDTLYARSVIDQNRLKKQEGNLLFKFIFNGLNAYEVLENGTEIIGLHKKK
jgi:hypothetical protein